MGVLAWKIGQVKVDGGPLLPPNVLYIIYGVLGLIYLVL